MFKTMISSFLRCLVINLKSFVVPCYVQDNDSKSFVVLCYVQDYDSKFFAVLRN